MCEKTGYVNCHLDLKDYVKHRLIAIQWIENPNNFSFVDHKDRNKLNNHVENLRWIDNSGNQQNNSSYKGIKAHYVNEIPSGCKPIIRYNDHIFKNYFIDENNVIYHYNEFQYRVIEGYVKKNVRHYNLRDINRNTVAIYLNKLRSYL